MSFQLYDYRNDKGVNCIKEWTLGLQKESRARLNSKLDMLEQHGTGLPPKLLSDTRVPGIKKLRITGKHIPTLRPMLCKGPINNDLEFTLLQGAIEQDRKLVPSDADSIAEANKQLILESQFRRCTHERVS